MSCIDWTAHHRALCRHTTYLRNRTLGEALGDEHLGTWRARRVAEHYERTTMRERIIRQGIPT